MRQRVNSKFRVVLGSTTSLAFAVSFTAQADCTFTNTCLGEDALISDVNGFFNTAIGAETLRVSVSNRFDTAVGYSALRDNIDDFNTAVGAFALSRNTRGFDNTAVGSSALSENTTGILNTAVGSSALGSNNGTANSAFGVAALGLNTTGNRNVAVGNFVMHENTIGQDNTAIGNEALIHNTTGYANSADGQLALWSNTTGRQNTAIGGSALYSNTTGVHSAALGNRALFNATTGKRNIALGFKAGYEVTTGSDNIIIGANNLGVASDDGVIRIGADAYQKKAFLAGVRGVQTGLSSATAVFVDANGQLGTIKSSRIYKEDIQSMGSVSDRLLALRPVTFHYKQAFDDGSKPTEFGLIAEEVAEVFPELVVNDSEGKPETVRYDLMSTLLLNEFQQEHRTVKAQAQRIAALEAQVAELVARFGDN